MFTLMAGWWLFLNPFANGLTESDVKLQETMVLTASYCKNSELYWQPPKYNMEPQL